MTKETEGCKEKRNEALSLSFLSFSLLLLLLCECERERGRKGGDYESKVISITNQSTQIINPYITVIVSFGWNEKQS